MNKMLQRSLPFLGLALVAGCDETPRRVPEALAAARPIAVESGLVYTINPEEPARQKGDSVAVVTARGSNLTIDLSSDEPKLVERALPPGYARSLPRPGHAGEVVVLTTGHDQFVEKGKVVAAENGHVLVFNRAGQTLDVQLSGNFNQFALSDDGRFAVASVPFGNSIADNTIAVVDLDRALQEGAAASTLVTLGLDGRAPTRLEFSPAATFSRRLLVLFFPNAIQLLDLEHPERGEISVPVAAQELLFVREAGSSAERIYAYASGAREVIVFDLLAAPQTAQGFRLAPSFISVSGSVTDIAVIGAGSSSRLLAMASGLEIVDTVTRDTVRVAGSSGFSSLLPFEGKSPVDAQVAPRALLYQRGLPRVGFVETGGASSWSSRSVELVELAEPVYSIVALRTQKLALAFHGQGSSSRISILDLEQRRVVPIRLESALVAYLLDETEARARLWTANTSGIVGVLDLVSLQRTPIPVVLEQTGERPAADSVEWSSGALVLIPGAQRKVALVHSSNSGRITLLNADFDANAPATLAPRELAGFFFADLFD